MDERKEGSDVHGLAPTNEIVAGILTSRYRQDKAFAALLDSDPKQALGSLVPDGALPAGFQVRTAQNTAGLVHVPLPCYPALSDREEQALTDKQLSDIAGGEIIGAIIVALSVIGGVGLGVSAGTATAIGAGAVVAGTAAAVGAVAVGAGVGGAAATGRL